MEKTKHLTVVMNAELHKRLKIALEQKDKKMSDWIREKVKEYLEKEKI